MSFPSVFSVFTHPSAFKYTLIFPIWKQNFNSYLLPATLLGLSDFLQANTSESSLCSLLLSHHISFVLPHPLFGLCLCHSTKFHQNDSEVTSDLCWDKSTLLGVISQYSAPQFPSLAAPTSVHLHLIFWSLLPSLLFWICLLLFSLNYRWQLLMAWFCSSVRILHSGSHALTLLPRFYWSSFLKRLT